MGRVVAAAVWFSLAVGLLELPLVAFKLYGLDVPVFKNPQIVWMAPVSYLIVLAPLSLALYAASRYLPRLTAPRVQAMLLAGLGAYSALMVYRVQLYRWAILILAIGVGVQVGRWVAADPDRFRRVVRRSTPWLAATVALLTLVVNGRRLVEERLALAALPDAPTTGAPNVLLLILDTVRAQSLGVYEYDRPTTPELSALARTGVVFDRAVSTASWTNPSHASMFTGHFPHNVSSDWGSGLDDTHPTIAEALRDRGYRTAAFSANTRYVSRQAGYGRGFTRFEDFPTFTVSGTATMSWLGEFFFHKQSRVGRLLRIEDTPERKRAPDVQQPLLDWIDREGDRPFFAAVNYMDGHDPYLPPEPFATQFATQPRRSLLERIHARLTGSADEGLSGREVYRNWVRRELDAYDGSLAYLDSELGALFDGLERRGMLENTLVVLTADHGEEFDEHGIMGHGRSLYWPVVHVPMIVWFPGRIPEGVRIDDPVSIRSVPATIMDLLAIDDGPTFPGTPLARFWDGTPNPTDVVLSELTDADDAAGTAPISKGDMKSLVIGSLHYIRNGDGSEELYDIAEDPWERENLIETASDEMLEPFRKVIDAIPARTSTARRSF